MQRIGENWLSQSSKNRIEPSTNPSFAEGVFAKATVDQGASPAILVGRLGKHLQRREQVGVLALVSSSLSLPLPMVRSVAVAIHRPKAPAGTAMRIRNSGFEHWSGISRSNWRDVPVADWRVHATAWNLFLHAKDSKAAETHRARAEAYVLAIANSFVPGEPLRRTFLEAAAVRRILKARQLTTKTVTTHAG